MAVLVAGSVWSGMAAAADCPDYTLFGQKVTLSGEELYSEKSFSVQAGGDIEIGSCRSVKPRSQTGQGYVTEAPDFSFELSGMDDYQLVVKTVSQCDSILLVNTGSAEWYYDDDDNGNLDAKITLAKPADGWLDVWVGTHDGGVCDAYLSLETFDR